MFQVADIEFVPIHGLVLESLSKNIRRMRNPKVSSFLVFANMETVSLLADAVT